MGVWQLEHRPRSANHDKTGMFSHGLILYPHLGQDEPGNTIDLPAGNL